MIRILQSGAAKSGNFWLYRIIKEARDIAGVETTSWITRQPIYETAQSWTFANQEQVSIDTVDIEEDEVYARIARKFREPIEDMDAYLAESNHVWTHSLWKEQQADFYKRFDRIVYIVRDPRDIALSKANFAFGDYKKSQKTHQETSPESYLENRMAGAIVSWVRHVGHHLQNREAFNIHFVFYEKMLNDLDGELGRLLAYLDLDLDQAQFEELKGRIVFASMKKRDPGHVSTGKSYRWMNTFSDKQKEQAIRVAGPMLEALGYPMCESETPELPHLPAADLPLDFIDKAISHSRGSLIDKLNLAAKLLQSRRPWSEKIRKGVKFLLDRPVQ